MNTKEESGLKVAEFLLQIKAIELSPDNPFTWASGWNSPIYCDNRKTLSYPAVRTHIRQEFVEQINENYGKPDVIVGVATGGIALGALVAQDMGLPFAYVRSSAKGHGLQNLIEGVVESGQTVVVVEDLISTGMSSLNAVKALEEAEVNVKGMVAIFSYGFDVARENFENAGVALKTLTDYDTMVKQALNSGFISEKQVDLLRNWRENPSEWGK
ncbi:MAG: orotate phosphoribosyltransferase [Flavobacteriales bacterium]|nr:orotate phosphoribosyltransferase [Flavobacteriales bacterium]MDG2247030.1 orotate phosphoribosyltransferase [Flavobacteriales bacterium]